MQVSHQKLNNIVILKVSGKLDSNTSPEFETKLFSFINEGEKKILVDCEQLDYISSAGLRVLLFAAKKLKVSGGKVGLVSLKEHIKEVFEISGFTAIFDIYNSSDEAVKTI